MREILFATKVWNFVCSFAIYFNKDWLSVLKVDWLSFKNFSAFCQLKQPALQLPVPCEGCSSVLKEPLLLYQAWRTHVPYDCRQSVSIACSNSIRYSIDSMLLRVWGFSFTITLNLNMSSSTLHKYPNALSTGNLSLSRSSSLTSWALSSFGICAWTDHPFGQTKSSLLTQRCKLLDQLYCFLLRWEGLQAVINIEIVLNSSYYLGMKSAFVVSSCLS